MFTLQGVAIRGVRFPCGRRRDFAGGCGTRQHPTWRRLTAWPRPLQGGSRHGSTEHRWRHRSI